jgi:DNA-binding response OmpR family regulator
LVTRQQLHQLFWQGKPAVETRSLDTHISQLRNKLQLGLSHDPQHPCRFALQMVYGTGYRLERL